jgi:hypothetical protein
MSGKTEKLTFSRRKIRAGTKDATFRLSIIETSMRTYKVVQVMTLAWRTLTPSDRIFKLLTVIKWKLSKSAQHDISRFCILTPAE